MLLTFLDLILIFLSVGISLGIVVPLTGVLVRFRANFNPKALQLDAEGGAIPHTGPVINSYFSMMMRVWRYEVGHFFWITTYLAHCAFAGCPGLLQGLQYVLQTFIVQRNSSSIHIVPTAISTFFVTLAVLIFMGTFDLRRGNYNAPGASLLVCPCRDWNRITWV